MPKEVLAASMGEAARWPREEKHEGRGKKSKKAEEEIVTRPATKGDQPVDGDNGKKTPATTMAPRFKLQSTNGEVEAMSDDVEGLLLLERDPLGLNREEEIDPKNVTNAAAGMWPELSAGDLALPSEDKAAEIGQEQ